MARWPNFGPKLPGCDPSLMALRVDQVQRRANMRRDPRVETETEEDDRAGDIPEATKSGPVLAGAPRDRALPPAGPHLREGMRHTAMTSLSPMPAPPFSQASPGIAACQPWPRGMPALASRSTRADIAGGQVGHLGGQVWPPRCQTKGANPAHPRAPSSRKNTRLCRGSPRRPASSGSWEGECGER